jgi:hypothetical protein
MRVKKGKRAGEQVKEHVDDIRGLLAQVKALLGAIETRLGDIEEKNPDLQPQFKTGSAFGRTACAEKPLRTPRAPRVDPNLGTL